MFSQSSFMKRVVTFFVFNLFAFFVFTSGVKAQVSGAIFTTDTTCSGVNINIFDNRQVVYLDGGPTHQGAAGLPNGEYYVRVTEPNGALLGTSLGTLDETPVVVNDGEFASCYQLWLILEKNSDQTVGYDLTTNGGGEYKVWVSTVASFDNSNTKTDNFKVYESTVTPAPSSTPTPMPIARLRVEKFYDINANGLFDAGEALINGWKVRIQDGIDYIRYTLVDIFLAPDDYTVTEFMPVETNWVTTTLNPQTVILNNGDDKTVRFGNVCLGEGGGKTKGYWSNKNGQATMNDDGSMGPELSLLRALNLRTAGGVDFNPWFYSEYRAWLTKATATNMSYMLSAQLSAMALNVESGMVGGSALVYHPVLGFVSVNDLMSLANTELGLHGFVLDGNTYRSYQENLKNAFDDANNNTNFVQSSPCPFSFAE
jgi:hypothetical protein